MGLLKQGTGDVNTKYMLRRKGKMKSRSSKGRQRREDRNWMSKAVDNMRKYNWKYALIHIPKCSMLKLGRQP